MHPTHLASEPLPFSQAHPSLHLHWLNLTKVTVIISGGAPLGQAVLEMLNISHPM